MRYLLAATLIAATVNPFAMAQTKAQAAIDARINAATAVLQDLMSPSQKGVPAGVSTKATCVLVVPSFKKAAFVFGGQYGQGVATCRTRSGHWSSPAFVQLEGASFGLQIGGQSTDLLLLGMNHHAMDDLLKDKLKLGGDASVSVGPVGRNAQADTTETANAEFLSYSHSKGLFAGVDLSGDVVHQNTEDTKKFYGHNVPFAKILGGEEATPAAARHFIATVTKLFHQ